MTQDAGRLQELIQADLDGELSVAERADLARLLLQDPEARRLQNEFRKTDRLLRDIADAEPPPELRAAILAASAHSARSNDPGSLQHRRPLYRIAAAILGGLLVVGISYLLLDASPRGTDLQGSMGAANSRKTQHVAPLEYLSMRAEGIEVRASLQREGQTFRLELNSTATIPCEVIARIDPATTAFVGSPRDASLNSASDQVTVRVATGTQSVMLDFSGAAHIQLQLRSNGLLLGEGSLSVGER